MASQPHPPDPDHQRLEALLHEHGARLGGWLARYNLGRHGIDPDEVVQEVRIRLWQAIQRDRSRPFSASYIQRIVASTAIDAMRRSRVRSSEPLPEEDEGSDLSMADLGPRPDRHASDDQRMLILERCLAALPERRRIPIGLHLQGFGFREIGELSGISDEAARKLVSRGMDDLKKLLRESGLGVSDD
ncbi:MAG TPA: RNA polymerase sigma factor [Rhodanobacteraceae bacterium]|nr:RNA polymerase sigma factor [Rhodanobacteraceae bacterium]